MLDFTRQFRRLATLGGLSLAFGAGAAALAGDNPDLEAIGYYDLVERLGEGNVPTGAGVIVGQVEANEGANYGPNQGAGDFAGKTFIAESGAPGTSGHATTVAKNFYGLFDSAAPDVDTIHLWSAVGWIFSFLGATNGAETFPPDQPPAGLRIFNGSWIGDLDSAPFNNSALRRADRVVELSDVLIINGVNNAAGAGDNLPLMSHIYNGLAVGKMNGAHQANATGNGVDGPGRQKPEIVAPGAATSWATPIVSAVGAVLYETAETDPALVGNDNADRSAVIRAILMASAVHRDGWTNNPISSGSGRGVTTTPLDDVYGADLVNIDRAHLTHTAGEQDGATDPASAPTIDEAGWDFESLGYGESRFYAFEITEPTDDFSVVATWNRRIRLSQGLVTVGDFDLYLWEVDGDGELVSLVGDGGLDNFDEGAVVSISPINNIEHLYVNGLQPGSYMIELRRIDETSIYPTFDAGLAWIFPEQPDAGDPADLNGDGGVGAADLAILLGSWGPCEGCPADLDGDGVVGAGDLAILLGAWTG